VTGQRRCEIVGPHGTPDYDVEFLGRVAAERGTPERRDGVSARQTLRDQGLTGLASCTENEKAHQHS
jgi:hypothetical protein